MKNLKVLLIITGILVAGLAFTASAQRRAEKTAGAQATYGKSERPKIKSTSYHSKRVKAGIKKAPKYKSRVQAKDGYRRKRVTS